MWYDHDKMRGRAESQILKLPALYRVPLSTQVTMNCKRESASFMVF